MRRALIATLLLAVLTTVAPLHAQDVPTPEPPTSTSDVPTPEPPTVEPPTATLIPTDIPTQPPAPTATDFPTLTALPSDTPTDFPTSTPLPTDSPTPSLTPSATNTETATSTLTPTFTPNVETTAESTGELVYSTVTPISEIDLLNASTPTSNGTVTVVYDFTQGAQGFSRVIGSGDPEPSVGWRGQPGDGASPSVNGVAVRLPFFTNIPVYSWSADITSTVGWSTTYVVDGFTDCQPCGANWTNGNNPFSIGTVGVGRYSTSFSLYFYNHWGVPYDQAVAGTLILHKLYITYAVGATPYTATPTATHTPTATFTPSNTPTPTLTPTATFIPNNEIQPDLGVPFPPSELYSLYQANRIDTGGQFVDINPFLGSCDPDNTRNCVTYTYLAFVEVFNLQKPLFSNNIDLAALRDLIAITLHGEISPYLNRLDLQDVAYEAFGRNFFDPNSGACRYEASVNAFNCSYENVINWLNGTQHWRDSVDIENIDNDPELEIRVDLLKLTGIVRENIGNSQFDEGYLDWDQGALGELLSPDNLMDWRTGQGGNVPSTWGNIRLQSGQTSYTHNCADGSSCPQEDQGHLITHRFPYGLAFRYTYNEDVVYGDNAEVERYVPSGTLLTQIDCTVVSVITTSDGRIPSNTLSACPG